MAAVDMTVALDGKPLDLARAYNDAEDTTAKQLANTYASDTLPSRVAGEQAQSQLSQYAAQVAGERSKLETSQMRAARLASVLATPQTADEWDAAVDNAVQDGLPEAAQYRGRYNPQRQADWVRGLYAQSQGAPVSALAGYGGMASGPGAALAGAGPGGGQPLSDEQVAQAFSQPGVDLAKVQANLAKYEDGIQQVLRSQNPQATFNQLAGQFGHPEWVGRDYRDAIAALQQQLAPFQRYSAALQLQGNLGLGKPAAPSQLKQVGKDLVRVSGYPGQETATPVYEGSYKPTAYEDRRQAYLAVHPGDAEGALAYAGGKGTLGAGMSQAKIEQYAESQSARELANAQMSGEPVSDPVQWQAARKAEIIQNLTQANGRDQTAAGAGGGFRANGYRMPPQQAIDYLKAHPETWRSFDKHFGPQASAHVLNPKKYGDLS